MHSKSGSFVSFVLAVSILSAVTDADVDCSKRPQRVDPKMCCPIPELITAEIKEKCKEFDMAPPMPVSDETGVDEDASSKTSKRPPHHRHHHHRHNPCFMSCVLNETGIFADDKLDDGKLSDYLNVVLNEVKDMIPIIQESFQTCAAKSADFKPKMSNNPRMSAPAGANTQPPCRAGAGFMMGCVFVNSFNNCAASVWNDNETCNDMREHMKNCKPRRGPGGPGGPGGPPNSMENDM